MTSNSMSPLSLVPAINQRCSTVNHAPPNDNRSGHQGGRVYQQRSGRQHSPAPADPLRCRPVRTIEMSAAQILSSPTVPKLLPMPETTTALTA